MEDEYESYDGFEPKSPSAVDYSNISDNSLSDEEEEKKTVCEDSVDNGSPASDTDCSHQNWAAIKDIVFSQGDKPLASVLPAKYQETDVRSLFPDYRPDRGVRFLRTFKIPKHNLPNLWRGVKNRKQNKNNADISIRKEPLELEVESDEEIKFMKDRSGSEVLYSAEDTVKCMPLNNEWRYGPAKLWYDMAEVPETVETYDYGLKLKDSAEDELLIDSEVPEEAFLMLNQLTWEDDVIWDGDDSRDEIMNKTFSSTKSAGWIPFLADRTVSGYREYIKNMSSRLDTDSGGFYDSARSLLNKVKINKFQPMFSEENVNLIHDRWEDDVIWDCEKMARISYPQPLKINDPDIILNIPEDKPPIKEAIEVPKDAKDKKPRPPIKKVTEEEESTPGINKPDFFNVSNDEFYNPKMTQETALKLNFGGSLLQHSIPAMELRPPYFPTHLGLGALQRFHRPTLRIYSHGPFAYFGDFHGVHCLYKHIKQKAKDRRKELEESGGGEMFFMRTPADLSGQDGDLVLFEFSEEFPPVMSQVGMASKIRNYYRRRPGKDTPLVDYKYGEIAYAHTSPFLGALQPGQSLQAYENHLFRASIYEHQMQGTDFLIIRTRYKYYIREIETIYTVGQQLPLIEVPAPKSEKTKNFLKDFLNVFIYRLFAKSRENPRRIRIEAVKKAFPSIREFSIRKRLNMCASFQRTGSGTKYWVLNNGFRLPSEEEIRQTISPEQCCAFYSMLSAEQRLKDAGYGDKFVVAGDEDNEFLQNKIDDEVKAAPWNTTQSFISAIEGKCMLELIGSADPTGCGEGFSYVKISNKAQSLKDESNQNSSKRLVRGTDADLRRLSLSNAKKLLKSYNVSDKQLKNLSRWQIIDMVRVVSTEQAKLGDGGVVPKFARGNFYSQAEHARRYKEECQRLFELQNNVLSSNEVLSSDEDSSSEEDSDIEEMGKHIENIISNKKTAEQLSHESEEAERKQLKKLVASAQPLKDNPKGKDDKMPPSMEGKVLKIYRTYTNSRGLKFERVETVRRVPVVELYLKIRETQSDDFVKNYSLDEEHKEAIRKERRRLQDQLRRIKKNELKDRVNEPPRKKYKPETPSLKVKCGACGASGHMRTNRACPLYQNSPSLPSIQVAMTEEQEEAEEQIGLEDRDLVKIDETKIILSKQLVKHVDEVKRKSLVLKISKETLNSGKKKRSFELTNSDYLSTPKFVNRKRTDPVVSISVIFENLINELKGLPHTQPFWHPVKLKEAPNYNNVIANPMDLNSMKDKIRGQKYQSREDFLKDLQLIVENSTKYNGSHSFFTLTAHSMLEHCFNVFTEKEKRLMELEKLINPLLDNDQVAFSFMLERIVTENLKTVQDSWPFHKPVDKRLAKGYYDIVEHPIDLNALISYCKANKYKTRQAFLSDVELIYSNSLLFNGPDSNFTRIAQEIVKACHMALDVLYKEPLEKREAKLLSSDNTDSIVHNLPFAPKRTRKTVKPKIILNRPEHSSKYNGSIDTDSFVDVESLGSIPDENIYEKESVLSDKSVVSENVEHILQQPISYSDDLNLSEKSDEEDDAAMSNLILQDLELSDSDEEGNLDNSPQDINFAVADPSITKFDLDLSSDFTSPSVSSNVQSLMPINGFHEVESVGNSSTFHQPHSQNTCDIICDDLILSESDSDEEMPTVLKF